MVPNLVFLAPQGAGTLAEEVGGSGWCGSVENQREHSAVWLMLMEPCTAMTLCIGGMCIYVI